MRNPLPPPPANKEDDDAYYRAVLQGLIARGAEIAAKIHEAATTPEINPLSETQSDTQPAHKPTVPTIAYDRILRTVRRTIALARAIAAGPPQPLPRPGMAQTPGPAREHLTEFVRSDLQNRQSRDPGSFSADSVERPEAAEILPGLDGRPIEDIIDEIRRELELAGPEHPRNRPTYVWKQRTQQDLPPQKPTRPKQPPASPRIRQFRPAETPEKPWPKPEDIPKASPD